MLVAQIMKIVYTKHAENKFKYSAELKWNLTKKHIKEAIQNPDLHQVDNEKKVEIVLKTFDERRNLRVVYSKTSGIITVITYYLTTKGRYHEKK